MTTQTLVTERPANFSTSSELASRLESLSSNPQQARILAALKSQYPVDQQEKFLHLQAETESLLQQLQAIKQQRQTDEMTLEHSGVGDRVPA